jgi:hypothetical protein
MIFVDVSIDVSHNDSKMQPLGLLGMMYRAGEPDLLTATPSGSIADTAINSVYLLGMVCVRTLIC